jgi:anti-sigma regulatory factor (Ser/Thr protein kinase)
MSPMGVPAEGAPPLAADPPGRRAVLTAARSPFAARQARRFAAQACGAWQLPHCREAAVHIADELVTNAVTHGRGGVVLRLEHVGDVLEIAVQDEGPDFSPDWWDHEAGAGTERVSRHPADQRRHGLGIVRFLAAEVGGYREGSTGKVLWARVPAGEASPGAVTQRIPLDRRSRGEARPARQWRVELLLQWEPEDPASVRVTLESTPAHPALPRGRWRVQREALRSSLAAPVRDDTGVVLVPTRRGPGRVEAVVLTLPEDGRAQVVPVAAHHLRGFLDRLDRLDR